MMSAPRRVLSGTRMAEALPRGPGRMITWIAVLLVLSLVCYGIALGDQRIARDAAPSVASRLPLHRALPVAGSRAGAPRRIGASGMAPPAPARLMGGRGTAASTDWPAAGRADLGQVAATQLVAAVPPTGFRPHTAVRFAGQNDDTLPVAAAGLRAAGRGAWLRDLRLVTSLADVPARFAPMPAPAHRMLVWVTGYTLAGSTALGTVAGPGICAVDPAFIALGTRISIEGVGTCLAQDTGPEVLGAHIDVWVPGVAQAYALTGWHRAGW